MKSHLVIVLLAAAVAGACAGAVQMPAAWLIGPLLSTVVLSSRAGIVWRPPRTALVGAQAAVGMALGNAFDAQALTLLRTAWALVGLSVVGILAISVVVGVMLARFTRLDRTTAVLGCIPGGAPAMIALSDELNAHTPLVAFMQYARLCLVALSASFIARIAGGSHALSAATAPAAVPWIGYINALGLAIGGAWLGTLVRLPAASLVGPVLAGAIAGGLGVAHAVVPPGVLPLANAIIGITVGARFDRTVLRQIGQLLAPTLGAMLALMLGCSVLAAGFVVFSDLDVLSAYLATTPGGIDAVLIAALDSGAQVAVILPVQILRLLVMILAGPWLARWLATHPPSTNSSAASQMPAEDNLPS